MGKTLMQDISFEGESLAYQLILSRRKSLAIVVHPDLRVIVKAPAHCRMKKIEQFVLKQFQWIQQKLKSFERHEAKFTRLQFIAGELHFYLGKTYPLSIMLGDLNAVTLENDAFIITCLDDTSPKAVKKQLDAWYLLEAKRLFEPLMTACWIRFNHPELNMPAMSIRKMSSRWGSFSAKTYRVALNSELVKSSLDCIESVIMHEFCHIKHLNHGANFYALLEHVSPDWRACNKQLNRQLLRI
jgi:predicted metal-dependent hydrolase